VTPGPGRLSAAKVQPAVSLRPAAYRLPAADPAAMPPGMGSPGSGDFSALPGKWCENCAFRTESTPALLPPAELRYHLKREFPAAKSCRRGGEGTAPATAFHNLRVRGRLSRGGAFRGCPCAHRTHGGD